MKEHNILPCPFCGGDPRILRHGWDFRYSYVYCDGCSARTEDNISDEFAINSWNKRDNAFEKGIRLYLQKICWDEKDIKGIIDYAKRYKKI